MGWDRLGRSEPAFLSANTTALPPLTCTARGRRHLQLLLCVLQGWPTVAGGFEACAGRSVCWLCPPAVPVLRAVFCLPCHFCLPCNICLPCPLPSSVLAPVHQFFAPIPFCFVCPCSLPCAPGSVRASSLSGPAVCFDQHACKLQDCPVGSRNTGLQWRPVRRVHL